jgi:xanthine dehydrogenase YagS FAD-binding subunit
VAQLQAGGTDLQDRVRRGTARGPFLPIRPPAVADTIEWRSDGVTIGALVRVNTLAHDPAIRGAYPGLAAAAGGLATPQIRAVATVGGALLQRTRCWYFRDPAVTCFKKGGSSCPARDGDHTYGVCFDLGPCIWPHPSTLGAALLAYDARVLSDPGGAIDASALFGDGTDGTRDHSLGDAEMLTSVTLGPALAGERAGYLRIIGRQFAEWPLVEVVVRVLVDGSRIAFARVALGGVAPVPLRLVELERAMVGAEANPDVIERLAAATLNRQQSPVATRYKLDLIPIAVADTLARALAPAAPDGTHDAKWSLPWRNL